MGFHLALDACEATDGPARGIRELVTGRDGRLVAMTIIVARRFAGPRIRGVEASRAGPTASLAAHPHQDVVVVGLKGGGWRNPASDVAFVRLD
jgi:hypothetical protein